MLSLICPLQRLCRIRLSPSHLKWSSPHGTTSTSGIPTIFMASLRWIGIIAETVAKNLRPIPPEMSNCHSILYTAGVTNTPKQVEQEIKAVRLSPSYLIDALKNGVPKEEPDALLRLRALPDPTE